MKKRKVNALLAIVLSLTMMVGVAGCGKKQQLEAEIDPGTPTCIRGAVSIKGNCRAFLYYKCTGYINTGSE